VNEALVMMFALHCHGTSPRASCLREADSSGAGLPLISGGLTIRRLAYSTLV
jgi:hypothetical protein